MNPREARLDALRRFGRPALAMDKSHDTDIYVWLDTIVQDLRYGIRTLISHPAVTVVALLSLGVAIGANTAIFSVVDAVLLRTLPYKRADAIAILRLTNT